MQPTETESLKLGQNRNRRPIFESETLLRNTRLPVVIVPPKRFSLILLTQPSSADCVALAFLFQWIG
jgi:hypothetical protein